MPQPASFLIDTVLEFRESYESKIQWWGEEKPGSHIIFGNLLNPYLVSLLKSKEQEEILRRIFAFLEELANHRDTQFQEVVTITVCERLGDSKELLLKARKHKGIKPIAEVLWQFQATYLYGIVEPLSGEHYFWSFLT